MSWPGLAYIEPLIGLEHSDGRAAYLAATASNLPVAQGTDADLSTYVAWTHPLHGGDAGLSRGRGLMGCKPDADHASTVVSAVVDPTNPNGRMMVRHSLPDGVGDGDELRLDYFLTNDPDSDAPIIDHDEAYLFGVVHLSVSGDAYDTIGDNVQFARIDRDSGTLAAFSLRRGGSNYRIRVFFAGQYTTIGSTLTAEPDTHIPYLIRYKADSGAGDGVLQLWLYTGGAWALESSVSTTTHTENRKIRAFVQRGTNPFTSTTVHATHSWRGWSGTQFPFFATDSLPSELDFVVTEVREPQKDAEDGVGMSLFGYCPLGLVGNALADGYDNLRIDLSATPVGEPEATPITASIELDTHNGGIGFLWGLTPGVRYVIARTLEGVDSGDGSSSSLELPSITTVPAIDPEGHAANIGGLTVAEAGCLKQTKGAHPYLAVERVVGEKSPDIFVWNGDIGYCDSRELPGVWSFAQETTPAFDDTTYEWFYRLGYWSPSRRAAWMAGSYNLHIFSDHEPGSVNNFTWDDFSSTTTYMNGPSHGGSYPVGMTANEYYLGGVSFLGEWFGAAMYGLGEDGISDLEYWRTFRAGNVRVVVMDTRWKQEKDAAPEGGDSVIGAEQRAWFTSNVASWTEPFVFVFTEGPLSKDPNVQGDNWRIFNADECEAILDDLDALPGRIGLSSSDRHCVTLRDDERRVEGRTHILFEAVVGPTANYGYGSYDPPTDPVEFDPDAEDGIVYSINHGGAVTGNPYGRRTASFEFDQAAGALDITVIDEDASDVVWSLEYPAGLSAGGEWISGGQFGPGAADFEFPMVEDAVILKGQAAGRVGGHARALQAGDPFLGFPFFAAADNTGGLDGEASVQLRTRGYVLADIAGVAQANLGDKAYMSGPSTVTLTAESNSRIGHIVAVPETGKAIVKYELQPD